MALAGLSMSWISVSNGFDAQPDSFMILFTSCAFLATILSRKIVSTRSKHLCLLITGCFIGCAIMFKQTAIFSLIGLLSYYLLINDETLKKKIIQLSFFSAGLLLTVPAFLIPLFISGATPSQYFCNVWLSLLNHYTTTIYTKIDHMLNAWRYSEITFFYPLIFIFLIFRKNLIALLIPFWGILIWFICDLVGVSASTLLWETNYKQLLPPLSVICGISISFIIEKILTDKQHRRKLMVKLMIIVFLLGIPFRTLFFYNALHIKAENMSFADWISINVSKENSIYIFGREASLIYLLAGIKTPYSHMSDVSTELSDSQQQRLTKELKENLPKFIAISENTDPTDQLVSLLKEQYKRFINKDVFQANYGFKIYKKIIKIHRNKTFNY